MAVKMIYYVDRTTNLFKINDWLMAIKYNFLFGIACVANFESLEFLSRTHFAAFAFHCFPSNIVDSRLKFMIFDGLD